MRSFSLCGRLRAAAGRSQSVNLFAHFTRFFDHLARAGRETLLKFIVIVRDEVAQNEFETTQVREFLIGCAPPFCTFLHARDCLRSGDRVRTRRLPDYQRAGGISSYFLTRRRDWIECSHIFRHRWMPTGEGGALKDTRRFCFSLLTARAGYPTPYAQSLLSPSERRRRPSHRRAA